MLHSLRYYIKDIVYGANDGIITTFAIVAAVTGADLSTKVILILGISNLFADGFSMATSSYLSSESDQAMLKKEGAVNDAHLQNISPYVSSTATFFSFLGAGIIPLIPYLLFFNKKTEEIFPYAMIATAITLFLVGSLRTFVTGRNFFRAGIEMLLLGGMAAVIAYLAGSGVNAVIV